MSSAASSTTSAAGGGQLRMWRLVKQRYASDPLSGEGARLFGGRWNHRGVPAVYTSESLALAALENLAHYDKDLAPPLVATQATADLALVTVAELAALPPDWRDLPTPRSTQDAGSAWLQSLDAAILRVPSIVVPTEWNYVLNSSHPDFRHITVASQEPFAYDRRLLEPS